MSETNRREDERQNDVREGETRLSVSFVSSKSKTTTTTTTSPFADIDIVIIINNNDNTSSNFASFGLLI